MKVRMTESQLKRIVKRLTENETLTVSADIHNGDISTGVKNAKADIQRNGLDPNKTKIEVDPNEVSEGKRFKKSELQEARKRRLNKRK